MNEDKEYDGSVLKGFGIGVGFILMSQLPSFVFPWWSMFVGVSQIAGIGPAIYLFGSWRLTRNGILIAAGLVFLLNAACFGLVFILMLDYQNM